MCIYKDIYHSRCITCQTRRLCGDVAKCTAGWEGGVPAVSYCICWWKEIPLTTTWNGAKTLSKNSKSPYQLVSLPDFWSINSNLQDFWVHSLTVDSWQLTALGGKRMWILHDLANSLSRQGCYRCTNSRRWFHHIFYVHPDFGGKWSNLTSIFVKWVDSTSKDSRMVHAGRPPTVGVKSSSWCRKRSLQFCGNHMGVSKNRGTPKWMVYNGKPY